MLRMSKQQPVDKARQRRALPAGGNIARAKIADGRDASTLGEDSRLDDLQRNVHLAAGQDIVPQRLTVRAD